VELLSGPSSREKFKYCPVPPTIAFKGLTAQPHVKLSS